jgi:hypothetical protein
MNKYRIYDNGPGFICLLLDVGPGRLQPLVPRFDLCRWTYYRNGELCESPESWRQEESYISEFIFDIEEALSLVKDLNSEHYKAYVAHEKARRPNLELIDE